MSLSPRRRRVVAALADTLFPSIAPEDPAGGDVLPDALDRFLEQAEPGTAQKLGIALDLLELAAIPVAGRPFSRLGDGARERYVEGWMRSRFAFQRGLYKTLRDLFANIYYGDERTWAFLGYGGPAVLGGGL